MMLDAEYSMKAARRTLRAFMPGESFSIISLKDPTNTYNTWVFRCKIKGKKDSFVCKLSTPDAFGREKILNQFNRMKAVKSYLTTAPYLSPQVCGFFEKECALIMEKVSGETLSQLIPTLSSITDADTYLRKAGGWISAFQAPTTRQVLFDPSPHTSWIIKKITLHKQNAISIPDYEDFMIEFDELKRNAECAKGHPAIQCITHRDFHAGNLVYSRNKSVYGLDFENGRYDESLRDVMSFLFDFFIKWCNKPLAGMDFQNSAQFFLDGYADSFTSPTVFEYFQRFTALNGWSGLGTRGPLGEGGNRKLTLLKAMSRNPLLLKS